MDDSNYNYEKYSILLHRFKIAKSPEKFKYYIENLKKEFLSLAD